jgi:Ca2+-binding RTX toxin-like protein
MANPTSYIPNQTASFIANQANTTYVLNEMNSVVTSSLIAVDGSNDADGRSFEIHGVIRDATIGLYTNSATSEANTVHIDETGLISVSAIGVKATGNNDVIINDGSIAAWNAMSYGFLLEGDDVNVVNNGTIRAQQAISLEGNGSITNTGHVTTHSYAGTTIGISVISDPGDVSRIINRGTIYAGQAIETGDGKEIITNSGIVTGDVSTGNGNDTITNRSDFHSDIGMGYGNDRYTGRADSHFTSLSMDEGNDIVDLRGVGAAGSTTVYGGSGNDQFLISSSNVILSEGSNGGTDIVKSSASFTLKQNFETLFLTGSARINGVGNELDNRLVGNSDNNRISGLAGADTLDGGGGNDILKGGAGADTFVFKAHAGDDRIADFQDGKDTIDLSGHKGLDTFSDLKGHIHQSGDDLVISLLNGDELTLADTAWSEITAKDFDF